METLKDIFEKFVNGLTDEEARKELVLAYLQMERCQEALDGNDVEPVEMKDNGQSSDLELFYKCKKAANELAYLNDIVSKSNERGDDDGE
jgi:hypothetical protein